MGEKCPNHSRNISVCTEGSSLMKHFEDPEEWKNAVFWQQPRGYWTPHQHKFQGYSVRTDEWRFSEYVNLLSEEEEEQSPAWADIVEFGELYDLASDQQENYNLYHDKNYQQTKIAMRKILHHGW